MNKDLIKSYLETTYTTYDPVIEIVVEKTNNDLKSLLKITNETYWVFITAENPRSQNLSKEENEDLNISLERDLINGNFPYINGAGIPKNPDWTPENSFLVLGMDKKTGIQLAIKYQQNAFIYGEIETTAELIYGYL